MITRDLVGAIHLARRILKLKHDFIHVEVQHGEDLTLEYRGKPLVVVNREELLVEKRSV